MAAALVPALESAGFEVEHVATGAAALDASDVDLVLLDLQLPDVDGMDLCRSLRELSGVPIIAVTARGRPEERVLGLRGGADDYVVKPFSLNELLARIDAVLRRTRPGDRGDELLSVGPVVVDARAHTVTVHGQPVSLTRKEFELLRFLMSNPGRALERSEILREVWNTSWEGKSRTVDVHIAVLRQKLGVESLISTIRGVGYRLQLAPDPAGRKA